MKHRAIKDLNQLNDKSLFEAISIGLKKVYTSCTQLDETSIMLGNIKDYRASKILRAIAREEAAKYMILLDVLRCPRKDNHEQFSRQLVKFNEHLAKGLYADLCGWKPSSYLQLREYIKPSLDQLYLDGPMGVDFIFRNEIISKREEAFYVDYVQYEDDEHKWISPIREEFAYFNNTPPIIKLIKSLHALGLDDVKPIQLFTEHWRSFEFSDETHYQDFRNSNIQIIEALGHIVTHKYDY